MSTHGLYCTVCKGTFESRESWILHLLTERHQSSSRQACLQWRRKERKCTIVVFSDKPVAEADTLLEHFSMRDLSTIVTDFVWWPDRPRMGLMQFESRNKVKEVLDGLGRLVLQLPDCFVRFKEARSYLDLEWDELICKGAATVSDIPLGSGDRKPKLLENGALDVESNDIGGTIKIKEELEPEPSLGTCLEMSIVKQESRDCGSCNATSEPNGNEETSPWLLRASEFSNLCKSIEICETDYHRLMEVVNGVRRILGNGYAVNMYRDFILKLYNPGSNILLLHVTWKKNTSIGFSDDEINQIEEKIDSLCHSILPELDGFKRKNCSSAFKSKLGGPLYKNPRTGMRFSVTCDLLRNVEVQLGRMLEYFCSFDPCVKPLFSLVYIWTRANRVYFADRTIDNSNITLPDPVALDWLIILFLSREGVLPTVGEILERSRSSSGINFEADPDFAEEWRKNKNGNHFPQESKFIVKVLRLLKEFFQLLDELRKDKMKLILNPRDGEILERDELFSDLQNCETKLSSHEISVLKELVEETDLRIYMINPLCLTWKLSLCNKSLNKFAWLFKATAARMKKFVNRYSAAEYRHVKMDLEEALVGPQGMAKRKLEVSRMEKKAERELERT